MALRLHNSLCIETIFKSNGGGADGVGAYAGDGSEKCDSLMWKRADLVVQRGFFFLFWSLFILFVH